MATIVLSCDDLERVVQSLLLERKAWADIPPAALVPSGLVEGYLEPLDRLIETFRAAAVRDCCG